VFRDVARVRPAFQDEADIMKTNGSRTLTMVVIKTKESDIIRLVGRVKKELAAFEDGHSWRDEDNDPPMIIRIMFSAA
jgi:multidrug efflux pump subunit AcrB